MNIEITKIDIDLNVILLILYHVSTKETQNYSTNNPKAQNSVKYVIYRWYQFEIGISYRFQKLNTIAQNYLRLITKMTHLNKDFTMVIHIIIIVENSANFTSTYQNYASIVLLMRFPNQQPMKTNFVSTQ